MISDRDPIVQRTILDVQWSNLDDEVVEEVGRLWRNSGLGNDYYYYEWTEDDFMYAEDEEMPSEYCYPRIAAYLRSRGIESCLIHYWW